MMAYVTNSKARLAWCVQKWRECVDNYADPTLACAILSLVFNSGYLGNPISLIIERSVRALWTCGDGDVSTQALSFSPSALTRQHTIAVQHTLLLLPPPPPPPRPPFFFFFFSLASTVQEFLLLQEFSNILYKTIGEMLSNQQTTTTTLVAGVRKFIEMNTTSIKPIIAYTIAKKENHTQKVTLIQFTIHNNAQDKHRGGKERGREREAQTERGTGQRQREIHRGLRQTYRDRDKWRAVGGGGGGRQIQSLDRDRFSARKGFYFTSTYSSKLNDDQIMGKKEKRKEKGKTSYIFYSLKSTGFQEEQISFNSILINTSTGQ